METTTKVKKMKLQIERSMRFLLSFSLLISQIFQNPSLATAAEGILDPITGVATLTVDATGPIPTTQTSDDAPQRDTTTDFMSESRTLSSTQASSTPATVSPSATLSKSDITPLSNPNVWRVAPTGNSSVVKPTLRGLDLRYNTYVGGWAGAAFNFDDLEAAGFQTKDLSGMSQIVLGMNGDISKVKVEFLHFKDNQIQHGTSIYLTGIRSDFEQVWAISTSDLKEAGVDLTKIYQINFIVEGNNKQGALRVNHLPIPVLTTTPDRTREDISTLVGVKHLAKTHPVGNTTTVSTIPNCWNCREGVKISYDTTVGGWAGGGYTFDDFGTLKGESQDLTDLSSLAIGLKGSANRVRMEMVDDSRRRSHVYLDGIQSDLTGIWEVSLSRFSQEVDLKRITQIFFIIEGSDQLGTLDVFLHRSSFTSPEGLVRTRSNPNFGYFERQTPIGYGTIYDVYDLRTGLRKATINKSVSLPAVGGGVTEVIGLPDVTRDGRFLIAGQWNSSPNGRPGEPLQHIDVYDILLGQLVERIDLPSPGNKGTAQDEQINRATNVELVAGLSRLIKVTFPSGEEQTYDLLEVESLTPTVSNPDFSYGVSKWPPAGGIPAMIHVFNKDNKYMASVLKKGKSTAGRLQEIIGAPDVSPDGKYLIAGLLEPTYTPNLLTQSLFIYDMATGKRVRGATLQYTNANLETLAKEIRFVPGSSKFARVIYPSGETRVIDVETGIMWEQAKSNHDYAFRLDFKYISLGKYEAALKLLNVVTGEIVELAYGGNILLNVDVSPNDTPGGPVVVYEVGGPLTVTYDRIYNVFIQRISDPSQKVSLTNNALDKNGTLSSVTFNPDSTSATIKIVTEFLDGTKLEDAYQVALDNLKISKLTSKIIAQGTNLHIDQDASFVMVGNGADYRNFEVWIFDASNGMDQLQLVHKKMVYPWMNLIGKFTLLDAFKTSQGDTVFSIGLSGKVAGSPYLATHIFTLPIGLEYRRSFEIVMAGAGFAATSVSYNGDLATYALVNSIGVSTTAKIDLTTFEIQTGFTGTWDRIFKTYFAYTDTVQTQSLTQFVAGVRYSMDFSNFDSKGVLFYKTRTTFWSDGVTTKTWEQINYANGTLKTAREVRTYDSVGILLTRLLQSFHPDGITVSTQEELTFVNNVKTKRVYKTFNSQGVILTQTVQDYFSDGTHVKTQSDTTYVNGATTLLEIQTFNSSSVILTKTVKTFYANGVNVKTQNDTTYTNGIRSKRVYREFKISGELILKIVDTYWGNGTTLKTRDRYTYATRSHCHNEYTSSGQLKSSLCSTF